MDTLLEQVLLLLEWSFLELEKISSQGTFSYHASGYQYIPGMWVSNGLSPDTWISSNGQLKSLGGSTLHTREVYKEPHEDLKHSYLLF